ncbi:MAG: HAMP domain-containing protein [Gammaproteobacteria bacterium]|nr:HAMP domain-containing protein [Gammaproteobacteria bacterium]
MSLYSKVVLLLCALFATYGAVDYAVQREVILPSFETLEADLARTAMDRVRRAIESELDQLQTFSADWGNWLETYQYMAGENPAFIEENMTPVTLEDAGLDVVAYLDNDARFVWRKGLDPATHADLDYAMLHGDGLGPSHPFFDAVRKGELAKGIVVTEHGPAMIVTAPVLDGGGNGPHRGSVLLARVITPEVAARIGEQAQVNLKVITPPLALAPDAGHASLLEPRVVTHELTNQVFLNLEDIFARPSVMLRIESPRAVSAQGRDAIGYALLSLFIAGVIVLIVLAIALRRMVLRPVSRLTQHAVEIGEGDDLSKRMNVRRQDEIGILAREFDRMVDKLADARRRLVDQSYEAGAAHVSSGVLHNIGNAMTPLAVSVATLQQRLRAAPSGEIEMVIAEIEAGTSDPARRADLELFLRLAGRELAQVVGRAGDDLAAIERQTEVIQATLAQQLQASRRGPVVENVALAALIEQGVEMVPPKLRQRLSIELDESVHQAGVLSLPRITMQQVVQNVVQNAAEAVRGPGDGRGRLAISSAVAFAADGREMLTLRFSDDGAGIAPDDLPRVFEKGFSTKSRDTNHGIGLHWCANAVNALGGHMRAESGAAGGATFLVALPLRQTGHAAEAA